MMTAKKQMRIINKHFKGDADMLIKTAKSVGILDPHTFLQRAVDAGLNTKGVEAMVLMGCGNPNVDAIDSYSRIVSGSEAISQTRGTENWEGVVFDTDRVKQKMRQLLKNLTQTNNKQKGEKQ